MKTLLFCVIAAAGLSGCAVYPTGPGYETYAVYPAGPAYETYGVPAGPVYPYVAQQPIYIQGGGVYRYNNVPHPHPYGYPRGYNRAHPGAIHAPLPRPHVQAPHPGRGMRDRDGDGIPNRFDRDRDRGRDRSNDDGRSEFDRRHNQNDHR